MYVRRLSKLGYDALMKMGNIEQVTKCARTGTKTIDSIYNGTARRTVIFGENTKMFKNGIHRTEARFCDGRIENIVFCNGEKFNYKLGTGNEIFGDALPCLKPKNVLENILKNGKQQIR